MEIVKEKKYVVLINIFAIVAFLSLLAPYSVYKLPGLHFICMALLVFSYLVYLGSAGVITVNRKEVFFFGFGWTFVFLISILLNFSIPSVSDIFSLLYGILFLSLSRDLQKPIIRKFLWLLAILLLLGIIEYLLYQFAHIGFIISNVTRTTVVKESYFIHLIFNIISSTAIIPRFQCLADEPGRIGTLCGLLLFFTWKVKSLRLPFYVILFSGILSFSLAFYVLLAVFLFASFRFNIRNIVLMIIASVVLFQLLKENLEVLIITRIDVEDAEDLDNRTTDTFDIYFDKAYDNGQLWLGVGAGNLPPQIRLGENGGNAGAKNWIFQYGIIGFFMVFIMYNILYRMRNNNRMVIYDYIFLLIFWISFYQRSSIIDSFTLLAFLAMPVRAEFQVVRNSIKTC